VLAVRDDELGVGDDEDACRRLPNAREIFGRSRGWSLDLSCARRVLRLAGSGFPGAG
jgi:hypothetical protein